MLPWLSLVTCWILNLAFLWVLVPLLLALGLTLFKFVVFVVWLFVAVFFLFFVWLLLARLKVKEFQMLLETLFLAVTRLLDKFFNRRNHAVTIKSSVVQLAKSQGTALPVWHAFTFADFFSIQLLANRTQADRLQAVRLSLVDCLVVSLQIRKISYLLVEFELWHVLVQHAQVPWKGKANDAGLRVHKDFSESCI